MCTSEKPYGCKQSQSPFHETRKQFWVFRGFWGFWGFRVESRKAKSKFPKNLTREALKKSNSSVEVVQESRHSVYVSSATEEHLSPINPFYISTRCVGLSMMEWDLYAFKYELKLREISAMKCVFLLVNALESLLSTILCQCCHVAMVNNALLVVCWI